MPARLALPAQTLSGPRVTLEPLSLDHVEPLARAATESRASYRFTRVPDGHDGTAEFVRSVLEERRRGSSLGYAVRFHGRIVGSTRFTDFCWWFDRGFPDAAEVGHTWYAASAQRTACNTETKLLMLTEAFQTWSVRRIMLKTDVRNHRSRTAILRLGATFDGVRRAHTLAPDGTVRDTVFYSITAAEWSDIREKLRARLSRGDQ